MTNDAPVFAPAMSPKEGAEAATALFREVFEAEPDGVWYAPGRCRSPCPTGRTWHCDAATTAPCVWSPPRPGRRSTS